MAGPQPLTGARWRKTVRETWETSAPGWGKWEPTILYSLSALHIPLVRALDLKPGHKLLDLACGTGEPALTFANWVQPRGSVTAVDYSANMLRIARERAKMLGIKNVRFRRGDLGRLSALRLGKFDRVVSRFGLFFAEDVESALDSIRKHLKPGGRAAFAVWGPTSENKAWELRGYACAPFLDEEPQPEKLPHPMRFARKGRLAKLMRDTGFRDVRTEAVRVPFVLPSAEDYWAMSTETSSSMVQLLRGLTKRERDTVRRRLVRAAKAYEKDGVLRLPGLAWVVSGRR
jgi:ubiquinone/menaquinone biosynthesis C-methylase UbiE